RIERRGSDQYIILLPGSSKIDANGAPQSGNPMYAAWFERAKVNGNVCVHGEKVWAYITRWRHQSPYFYFWNAVEIRPYTPTPPTDAGIVDNRREGDKYRKELTEDGEHLGEWVEGYVCLT